jgi:Interferon-induced transmembrane protein
MTQPYGQPYGGAAPIKNTIGWAIAAIFLFWPLAIPAFIASGKVNELAARGDMAGAQYQADQAKKWGKISLWIAIVIWVLTCLFVIVTTVLAAGAASTAGSGY